MFSQPLWLILAFVCTISMTACEGGNNTQPPLSIEAHLAQERAVYETVIQIPADGSFVIRDRTTSLFEPNMMGDNPDGYLEMVRGSLPTLQTETWQNSLSVGGEEVAFPDNLKTGGAYRLITDEAWAGYFGGTDTTAWDRFEAEYGAHAFGAYSRVGFNGDATQALLYRGVVCGVLCGSGGYVLLEKVDGAWQVIREYEVWMS
jgi:hypothetical protein